ncbi:MAG: FKBP-type peptidyl-prolyl cis-trans isomerase [Balneolaceae bacterium]
MKKMILPLVILSAAVILQGCLDSGESDHQRQVREADEMLESYISSNNIDAERQSSGVYIEKVVENEDGKQVVEDHVVGIVYTMTHLEGEYEVEAHTDTLNPLRFSNNYNANFSSLHPAGLMYEIDQMKLGERFRFYIPSYQAFGNYAHDDLFDMFSHFIIDVELTELKTEEEIFDEELEIINSYIEENEVEAESYPNGLYHVVTEQGVGKRPISTSRVEFHFTRKYLDGTVIESSEEDEPISVYLNNNQLVRGLEDGILLMKEGETAELIMPSKLAFGKSVQVIPQKLRDDWVEERQINPLAKPYSPVIYEIELLEVY